MFGRWLRNGLRPDPPAGAERLWDVVRRELPSADEETVSVVGAIAGLLVAVAYADRRYTQEEEAGVRRELQRVNGMTASGIDAICAILRENVIEVSTVQVPRYCRLLLDLGDRELRVEVLETLVDLAASDGVIDQAEVNLLRLTTTALGLGQDDYNAAQAKYRERLKTLLG